MNTVDERAVQAGIAFYNRPLLQLYDVFVHGFSNHFVWECPTERLVELYNTHISAEHLELGVGTGFLLTQCHLPSPQPQLTLVDLSPHSLRVAGHQLRRYAPHLCQANILEPFPFGNARFRSVALNYVLHCLPGTLADKQRLLERIRNVLAPSGVVFGATLLGETEQQNWLARQFSAFYNRHGAFSNQQDTAEQIVSLLARSFPHHETEQVGSALLFVGYAE